MRKFAALSIFILAAGIFFLIIGIDDPLLAPFGFVLAGLGAIFVFVWIRGMIYGKKEERKEKERERIREERQSKIVNGTWEFPWEKYYQSCKESGFTELSTPFWEAKAEALADAILREEGVQEEYRALYKSKEQLSEYLQKGREQDRQIQQEAEENKKRSQIASLTDEQNKEIDFQNSLKDKDGRQKRDAMLEKIIASYNKKIDAVYKAQEAMKELAFAVASSAAETKTTSWATTAGIANGLAGPVAGIVAGAEAMQRNAEIEAANRRNREIVNDAASSIIAGSYSLSSDFDTLKKERAVFGKAQYDLRTKVVVEGENTDALYRSLQISEATVTSKAGGALSIGVTIKSDYQSAQVPEGVRVCVDGTLEGHVYAGDLLVDIITLPLPLYGVECQSPKPVRAEALCGKYSINGEPYRVDWRPNKLWLMEL